MADDYTTHTVSTSGPACQALSPDQRSLMNIVETSFGIISWQAIRRGSFTGVADLTDGICAFIDGYNERCQPLHRLRSTKVEVQGPPCHKVRNLVEPLSQPARQVVLARVQFAGHLHRPAPAI
ncbi:hypothetical protein [Micromonospora sp. WMMC250]|uniref:hypothetical protein n=1 Tax=Micromonospora sp. WMMC250 TaxID=3014781 RepID=UPI0022B74096|nr:hypothetical protein [Micromonospora sp. WMMC250]MCZ7374034.1 hypothetical protein [Micromonospora sp. WMMC250]